MGKDKHAEKRSEKKKEIKETKLPAEFDDSSEDEEHLKKLKQVAHGKKEDEEVVEQSVTGEDEDSGDSSADSGSSSNDDSDSDSDSDSSDEEGSDDDAVSLSTTEILNSDPLYTILSQFFVTKDGKNIADILDEMNHKLKYLKVR